MHGHPRAAIDGRAWNPPADPPNHDRTDARPGPPRQNGGEGAGGGSGGSAGGAGGPGGGRRYASGMLLVVGIFAFGGLFLWGFFRASRTATQAPPSAAWAAPARKLRFVSYDAAGGAGGVSGVAGEVRALDPDFVFLRSVAGRDADALAADLGMARPNEPAAFYPVQGARPDSAGPAAVTGNLVLSKFPLYEARSIPNPGGGSFGVWAVAVVEGRKFYVACVQQAKAAEGGRPEKGIGSLLRAWDELKAPPIVLAGDFAVGPGDAGYAALTARLAPAVDPSHAGPASHPPGPPPDAFFYSPAWTVKAIGTAPGDRDRKPVWFEGAGR